MEGYGVLNTINASMYDNKSLGQLAKEYLETVGQSIEVEDVSLEIVKSLPDFMKDMFRMHIKYKTMIMMQNEIIEQTLRKMNLKEKVSKE